MPDTKPSLERIARHYWRSSFALRLEARSADPCEITVSNAVVELQAAAMHSGHPIISNDCARLVGAA